MLARVFAVDPAKDLPLLGFRQFRRTASSFARAQSIKTAPFAFPFRRLKPFVDRCAGKAIRRNHFAGILALAHARNGHAPDLFERFVIEFASISLHAKSIK
jgi:hypothetical protein